MERPTHAGQVGETFVDGVFFDRRRVASYDSVHAFRKNAVRLVVGRQYDRVGTHLAYLEKCHAALYAPRFGFVGAGRDDTALASCNDRFAAQRRIFGDFARCEERISVHVENRPRETTHGTPRHAIPEEYGRDLMYSPMNLQSGLPFASTGSLIFDSRMRSRCHLRP